MQLSFHRDRSQNPPACQLHECKDHLCSRFGTYYSVWHAKTTQEMFVESMQMYIRAIAFCGHKVAHVATRPKLNYLPRPRSQITFPLLLWWEKPTNIFYMMKRTIKIIRDTIY